MPVSDQQKKAIGFNRAGWRSAKHLRQQADGARGMPGAAFLHDLSHACRVGWAKSKKPTWAKEAYYQLTAKGRRYLQRRRFRLALEAFHLAEALKLSASRAELQRLGWYSVKHVGQVDSELVELGYYETATFFREKQNYRYYKLTSLGKKWARSHCLKRLEQDLRRQFKELRNRETQRCKDYIADPDSLVCAWSK